MAEFLLNMWIFKKVDGTFLQAQVTKNRITQTDCDGILATPQM